MDACSEFLPVHGDAVAIGARHAGVAMAGQALGLGAKDAGRTEKYQHQQTSQTHCPADLAPFSLLCGLGHSAVFFPPGKNGTRAPFPGMRNAQPAPDATRYVGFALTR